MSSIKEVIRNNALMCQNLSNVTNINKKDIDVMKISIQNLEDKVSFIMSELQQQKKATVPSASVLSPSAPAPVLSASAPAPVLSASASAPAPAPVLSASASAPAPAPASAPAPVLSASASAPSQELIYTEVSPAPPPSDENIVMNIN